MNPHFYLDTNVIVALLIKEEKTDVVRRALDILLDLKGSALFTSQFTFIEAAKVLINQKKKSPKETARLIRKATTDLTLSGYAFEIVPTSPSESYGFDDFFSDVGENMNLYNPGWGDAFHCVIMKNNRLENILSTDEKDDFEIVRGLNLFHPNQVIEAN